MSRPEIRLRAHLLRLPLAVPYRLSFGTQTRFDVILVGARDEDGREGWGEAAILPGYTTETVEGSWQLVSTAVGAINSVAKLRAFGSELLPTAPFAATALLSCVDWLERSAWLNQAGRFPLLGTVNGKADDEAALESEIEALLNQGYRTLKLKVGWEVDEDLRQVGVVQRIVAGRAQLRIDANQGYSTDDAVAFLSRLDPEGVELVEQPCAAGDWDAAVAVKRATGVPMMLDESIYGLPDVERAARLGCADYVKLKLMKLGSLGSLRDGLAMIQSFGMKAVLGNGVASDVGCWMEASAGLGLVSNAGEMNGFLKTPLQLLSPHLKMDGADLVLDGSLPCVDEGAIAVCEVAAAGGWPAPAIRRHG